MIKDKDFSVFIKAGHVLYVLVFSCVVYSHLKAFGKKQENKTHEKISYSTYSIYKLYILNKINYINGQIFIKN